MAHSDRVSNGALLDRDFIVDAASSPDRVQFSPRFAKTLDDYVQAIDRYNVSALRLSDRVADAMRKNSLLAPAIDKLPGTGGASIVIHPLSILEAKNDPEIQKAARSLANDRTINVSVEIEMPRWSQVQFGMIGSRFANDTQRLVRGLQEIRADLSRSGATLECSNARTALIEAQARLKAELPSDHRW